MSGDKVEVGVKVGTNVGVEVGKGVCVCVGDGRTVFVDVTVGSGIVVAGAQEENRNTATTISETIFFISFDLSCAPSHSNLKMRIY